jgi:protoheme ferro-lyase
MELYIPEVHGIAVARMVHIAVTCDLEAMQSRSFSRVVGLPLLPQWSAW